MTVKAGVDEGDHFLGVNGDELRALGCIVVAAGRLEQTIRTMMVDLYADPGTNQAKQTLKQLRAAAASNFPSHARLDGSGAIFEWADLADEALRDRHRPLHSASVRTAAGESLMTHLWSGDQHLVDAANHMKTAHALVDLNGRGWELCKALRHNPRTGVYLPNALYSGLFDGQWVPACDTDEGGADLARPTSAELDAWWAQFGPIPTVGSS